MNQVTIPLHVLGSLLVHLAETTAERDQARADLAKAQDALAAVMSERQQPVPADG